MAETNYVIIILGLITILGGIFILKHSYKCLKKGKTWSVYRFEYKLYSFDTEGKKAYKALLLNTLVGVGGILGGFILLLIGFGIFK